MKKGTIIATATAAFAGLCITIFFATSKSHDPFQQNISKLIKRKSTQDIRDAEYNLYKMGPSIIPRLLGELDSFTNPLTKDEIYTSCNYGYISQDTPDHLLGRTALLRSEMYGLISALDAQRYFEMVTNLCHSNSPDLCLALNDGVSERLTILSTNEFFTLTNMLASRQNDIETDEGEKLCIKNFFDRLTLVGNWTNFQK